MGEQLDIFGAPAPRAADKPAKPAKPSIEQRWADFHAENPHVMVALLRLARARLARGDNRIGVKALWEELRSELAKRDLAYDADFEGGDFSNGKYRLNNDFTALYARKLIELDGSLATVIEVRRRKA